MDRFIESLEDRRLMSGATLACVDAPVTAGPVQKRISRRAFGNFNTVVQTHHADATFLKGLQAIQFAVKRMTAATIGVNHDSVSTVQN